jgi:hypothetical protein
MRKRKEAIEEGGFFSKISAKLKSSVGAPKVGI